LTKGKGQEIWNTKQEQGQCQEGRTNGTESKGQGHVRDKTRQDRTRNPVGRVGLVAGVRGKSKSQVAPHHPRPRRVPERRALQAQSLQLAPASWSNWSWKARRSGTPRGEAPQKSAGVCCKIASRAFIDRPLHRSAPRKALSNRQPEREHWTLLVSMNSSALASVQGTLR
jgi:hypothetical protein